jgi:hypothetical protein
MVSENPFESFSTTRSDESPPKKWGAYLGFMQSYVRLPDDTVSEKRQERRQEHSDMGLRKSLRKFKGRVLGKKTAHFIHIGKTGGTAIKYVMKSYPSTDSYEIFIHNHKTVLRDIPEGEKVFFFLRDPVKRFVSAFYSRKREGRPRLYNPWTQGEREAFGRFETPRALAEALSSDDMEYRESAQRAMGEIGHIKSSYWDWFEDENYFRSRIDDILFIGFQESFEEDFETLKSILKLPAQAQLPQDDINTHRNPESVDRYMSESAVENLERWYSKDYEFIDICKKSALTGR